MSLDYGFGTMTGTTYNQSSVTLPLVTDDRKDFLQSNIRKILFWEAYFSRFIFLDKLLRNEIQSYLFWVIRNLWLIKVKKMIK